MLNKNATQNPSTLNPACNILDAIRIMAALITRRKNPRETTVIGKVRNTNMGFRYIFKSIMTNDTRNSKNDLEEIAAENNFKLFENCRVSSKKYLLTF